MKHSLQRVLLPLLFPLAFATARAQVQLSPWGNIQGIRVDGQLMDFCTSLCVVQKNWSGITATAKERQHPKYTRNGASQTVKTRIDSLYLTENVTDENRGAASVKIRLRAASAMDIAGAWLCLMLPRGAYSGGQLSSGKSKSASFSDENALRTFLSRPYDSLCFMSPSRQLTVTFTKAVRITLPKDGFRKENKKYFILMIPLVNGRMDSGQTASFACRFRVKGTINTRRVTLVLDTANPGRVFDGVGGNFRLQNPKEDTLVIDYCLKNLRVAWARVEMPWSLWQPEMNKDPIAAAKAGKLNSHVKKSMELAQRLSQMGIPLIVSAWFPPAWAVSGPLQLSPGTSGIWGNPLDSTKTSKIYQSIADYLVWLRDAYGVEVRDFSFNESDLGINVRQTAAEHDALIRGLGAYFASRGLKTKLLLGDNSDATTYRFIYPALHDSAAFPYIGAVSFHSWRGCTDVNLQKWANAATLLHKPLIVAEGSINAQAWRYPDIFSEPSYALKEITLYLRILSVCQPESILQWQLTSDYSLLAGGGIFGNTGPLHPTQRFWNLKQLASTPPGLRALHLSVHGNDVTAAALGDNKTGTYAIHIVNNGATRKVTVKGLPRRVKSMDMWVTDAAEGMQEQAPVKVKNGAAVLTLDAVSYTSLISR